MMSRDVLATTRWHSTPILLRMIGLPAYRRQSFRLIALRWRLIWEYSKSAHTD